MDFFEAPTQIKFLDEDENILGGIAYHDFIICGCCGGVFEVGDVVIVKAFEQWDDISSDILGE